MKFIILHTNDIHGRIEKLTQAATLINQIREENPDTPVFYFDAGDSEEQNSELSGMTKGVAMHRLLSRMGCNAVTVGNGALPRYSYQVLEKQAAASTYPHLMANLRMEDGSLIKGAQATTTLKTDALHIGIIGVTAELILNGTNVYDAFGLVQTPFIPLIHDLAQELRQDGANIIILLSHLGLREDREVAETMSSEIDIIIGGHSHSMLPDGEWVEKVLIAQAGDYAQHIGRIDCNWNGAQLSIENISLVPVSEDLLPAPELEDEIRKIKEDIDRSLAEIICELKTPFDFSLEHPCQLGNLMANVFRERYAADIGLSIAGTCFENGLRAGKLRRLDLWQATSSPACGSVVDIRGDQLEEIVRRGHDPERAALRPHALRGSAVGFIHLSGAEWRDNRLWVDGNPIIADRIYHAAADDWVFGNLGDYVNPEWGLEPIYPEPHMIVPDLLDEYLQEKKVISTE